MTAPDTVWGTGYGRKRHLVREGTRRAAGRRETARAACSDLIYLESFSDAGSEDLDFVMGREACTSCSKKAGLKRCPTCEGKGVVSA